MNKKQLKNQIRNLLKEELSKWNIYQDFLEFLEQEGLTPFSDPDEVNDIAYEVIASVGKQDEISVDALVKKAKEDYTKQTLGDNLNEFDPLSPKKKGRRYVPETIVFPKDIRMKFKGHFKLFKSASGEAKLYISTAAKQALESMRRGRGSVRDMSELAKELMDLPSPLKSVLKKYSPKINSGLKMYPVQSVIKDVVNGDIHFWNPSGPDTKDKAIDNTLGEIGMFLDPIGYTPTKPKKERYTKKFVKASEKTPGHGGYIYDIYDNGTKIKRIKGEGNANAYMNQLIKQNLNKKKGLDEKCGKDPLKELYSSLNNLFESIPSPVASFNDDDIDKIAKITGVNSGDPIFQGAVNKIRIPRRIYKDIDDSKDMLKVVEQLKKLGYTVNDDYDKSQLTIKKKGGYNLLGKKDGVVVGKNPPPRG